MSESLDRWDVYRLFCISSAGVDEGELQDRLGIVEDYLADYERLCCAFFEARRTAHTQEINRLVVDEAEERRFLHADAAFLPWKLFVKLSFAQAKMLMAEQESAMRHRVVRACAESFTDLFLAYEELQRMQLTWEALDSLALKACIVGRHGVREVQLARTSIPGRVPGSIFPPSSKAAAAVAAVRGLLAQERQERQGLEEARRQYTSTALLLLASNEKLRSFASASVGGTTPLPRLRSAPALTVRQVLHYSATRIQSAYRGYRVRAVRVVS
ncbi:hypothetical protein LSCM1_02691 [Leishmania martiniquensis]|uniref:Uncharacterized protein n=1 Tax=Leishmania martiniquensis TaxID=1580590 RepID=A0A836GPM7_9TRYP|nr:hypothetical protein LSCM1_02691 [Leishmania martiniquensis]